MSEWMRNGKEQVRWIEIVFPIPWSDPPQHGALRYKKRENGSETWVMGWGFYKATIASRVSSRTLRTQHGVVVTTVICLRGYRAKSAKGIRVRFLNPTGRLQGTGRTPPPAPIYSNICERAFNRGSSLHTLGPGIPQTTSHTDHISLAIRSRHWEKAILLLTHRIGRY